MGGMHLKNLIGKGTTTQQESSDGIKIINIKVCKMNSDRTTCKVHDGQTSDREEKER